MTFFEVHEVMRDGDRDGGEMGRRFGYETSKG